MFEVVSLDQPHTMLAGDCAFHLDGALDHAMYDIRSYASLLVIEQDNCFRRSEPRFNTIAKHTVKVTISNMANNCPKEPALAHVVFSLVDDVW